MGTARARVVVTLPAPADRVFDLLTEPALRATWLGADLVERTATRPRRARFDHPDGRVAITVDARDERCVLSVEHSRPADAGLAETTTTRWRERLSAPATRLEGGDG